MTCSNSRGAILGGLAAAVLFAATPVAAQDLPKSGRYTSHYGWTFEGSVQELGPNRVVYVGMLPGVNFNDRGSGFMHQTRTDCTIVNDVNDGRSNANGTCVVTDGAGDKAYLVWKCAGAMPVCDGDFQWVGGTGKFTGISGNNRFQGIFIGTTGAGYSLWNGEWRLP
jgi:hypothetical protein